MVECGVGTEN